MRTIQADVAIVGGGIVGVSTAYFLQGRGKRAVVLERKAVGTEASGLNGGGVRQQGRLLPEIPLASAAVRRWERLDSLLGHPTGYRQVGNMFIASTDREMEDLAAQSRAERSAGLETELLDANQVRELAPGLAPSFVGGKLCPTDGHAMPAQAMAALTAAAREAGAEIVTDARVEEIDVANGAVSYVRGGDVRVEAPVVLNAAGPWAPYVAQLVEAYLPIFPSRAHVTHTAPLGECVARPYILTAAWDLGACQWADGRMQLGGGANTGDPQRFSFRKQTVPEFVARIRRRAGEVFPALHGIELERAWAGTMECTPDMMPIVGPVDGPDGFLVCAGFSGHGFCLGPLMGELMAEWIADGRPSIDLSDFRHDRFVRPEGPLAVVVPEVQKAG